MAELVSDVIRRAALDAQGINDNWTHWEGSAIARAALDVAVTHLRGFAVERFDQYGPHDARGAAFWDAAGYVDETLIGDPLTRANLRYEPRPNPQKDGDDA